MKYLREDQGWLVEKVEHWNEWSKTRHDLFGLFDLLCIHRDTGKVAGVQVTTMGGKQPHIRKMKASKNLDVVRKANWLILLHSWRRLKKTGWTLDEEIL